MNYAEFMNVAVGLEAVYPKLIITTNDFAMEMWFELLKDIDLQSFNLIMKRYMSESKFQPTIADIRSIFADMKSPGVLDPSEAWGEVTRAIKKFGNYNEVAALESMSEETRNVVKSLGFKYLCLSEDQMADRAHFMKMYGMRVERSKKDLMLSEPLKNEIAMLSDKFSMPTIQIGTGKEDEEYERTQI